MLTYSDVKYINYIVRIIRFFLTILLELQSFLWGCCFQCLHSNRNGGLIYLALFISLTTKDAFKTKNYDHNEHLQSITLYVFKVKVVRLMLSHVPAEKIGLHIWNLLPKNNLFKKEKDVFFLCA